MPFFRYTVKNDQGQKMSGRIEAKSVRAAAAVLHERKLFVVDVKPVGDELIAHIQSVLFGVKQNGEAVERLRQTRSDERLSPAPLPRKSLLNHPSSRADRSSSPAGRG